MINVFLVDDHKIFLDGLQVLISNEPDMHVLGVAYSGPQALEMLKNMEAPDVIVLDIAMPGMKGVDLARIILKERPATKVMALSMYANNYIISEMISVGVKGYVLKDCSSKDLLLAIRAISSGGMFFCEEVSKIISKDYTQIMQQGPTSSEVTLTERELDVLKLLVDGKSVNEISQILHISKNTVNSHRTNIMVKLNCETIVDLIRYSIRKGFFEFDK